MKKVIFFGFLFALFLFGILRVSQIYWQKNFRFNFFNSPTTFILPTPTPNPKIGPKMIFIPPAEFESRFNQSGLKYTFIFRKKQRSLGSCRLIKDGNSWYLGLVLTDLPSLGKGYSYYLWIKDKKGKIFPLEHLYYQSQTKKAKIYLGFVNKELKQPSECLVSRENKEKPLYPFKVVYESSNR